jgi:hypothetical protein
MGRCRTTTSGRPDHGKKSIGIRMTDNLETPHDTGQPPADTHGFIRVSEAKRRYFGGAMSLRWWYRQIEVGRLPHFRAGGTVLLRPADVEAFVRAAFRETAEAKPDLPAAPAEAPESCMVKKQRSTPAPGGFRFFGN